MDLKETVKGLPLSPGVYIMKGADGEVLYVGKASSIKKRVSSYFRRSSALPERIRIMVGKVRQITCMPTSTEAEALIYENSLIKQLTPKYNVALKDGKSYPRLKLTVNERFPRLIITRRKIDDGAAYFGPYANAALLRQAVAGLRQLFPLRTCGKMPKKACLNYHIQQCPAPCEGKIDEAAYGEMVTELRFLLEGRTAEFLKVLTARMTAAAARQDFEEAARLRGSPRAISGKRFKAPIALPEAAVRSSSI